MSFVTRQRASLVLISVILSVVSLVLTGPVSAATSAHRAPPAAPGGGPPQGHRTAEACAGRVDADAAGLPGPVEAGSSGVRRDRPHRCGEPGREAGARRRATGLRSADLQSAYKLPSGTAGAGATVAIVDAYDDPTAAADLAVYRQRYGLPACTAANGCFRKIDQTGGTAYPPRDQSWATEISLDLDMVSAACPKCRILLVEANSANFSDLGAAVNEAVAQDAKYVSNSYGSYVNPATAQSQDAQYYNHPGVVIAASSGDSGFSSYAQFPADSPHVVAVGGTSLMRDPSVVWNVQANVPFVLQLLPVNDSVSAPSKSIFGWPTRTDVLNGSPGSHVKISN